MKTWLASLCLCLPLLAACAGKGAPAVSVITGESTSGGPGVLVTSLPADTPAPKLTSLHCHYGSQSVTAGDGYDADARICLHVGALVTVNFGQAPWPAGWQHPSIEGSAVALAPNLVGVPSTGQSVRVEAQHPGISLVRTSSPPPAGILAAVAVVGATIRVVR